MNQYSWFALDEQGRYHQFSCVATSEHEARITLVNSLVQIESIKSSLQWEHEKIQFLVKKMKDIEDIQRENPRLDHVVFDDVDEAYYELEYSLENSENRIEALIDQLNCNSFLDGSDLAIFQYGLSTVLYRIEDPTVSITMNDLMTLPPECKPFKPVFISHREF